MRLVQDDDVGKKCTASLLTDLKLRVTSQDSLARNSKSRVGIQSIGGLSGRK